MPIQLSRAKRPKRLEPRPIVELLQCVSIDDLCRLKAFPTKDQKRSILSITFKYPFLKRLIITHQSIDFEHVLGYKQTIALHWIRCGLAGQAADICLPRVFLRCSAAVFPPRPSSLQTLRPCNLRQPSLRPTYAPSLASHQTAPLSPTQRRHVRNQPRAPRSPT